MNRFCCVLLAVVLVLPLLAMAATNHTTLTLDHPLQVAGTQLQPGRYQVNWAGSGPRVEVSFERNGRTITSAPAKLVMEHSPYDRAFETTQVKGQRTLAVIYTKNEKLNFPAARAASR